MKKLFEEPKINLFSLVTERIADGLPLRDYAGGNFEVGEGSGEFPED